MQSLDLFKERQHSVIKLSDGKSYKIPAEYTVQEVERLLELQEQREEIEQQAVGSDKDAQLKRFWQSVFDQLEIIFQHYQPKVTADFLRSAVTHNEALEMLGFFQKYRHMALRNEIEKSDSPESKKKSKLAKSELRDLRRLITFMVINGFSLLELRNLYLDELYAFHAQLFYNLEKMGQVKDGSYDKIMNSNGGLQVEDTVNLLRKQMFKSIASKNKKQ